MSLPPLVAPGPALTAAEVERYSRHLLLPQVGVLGQRRLRAARVCVVGAGGLGAPVLLYLAAAGVGRIGIVDFDDVEVTNLQRQILHGQADVGRAKVDSARDAVLAIDPALDVVVHPVRLTPATVDAVLGGYDLVIDGTDNFPTRYLVNDACVRLGIPEVWGSVFRFDAQVAVFWGRPPAASAIAPVQLRDLFPAAPPAGSVPSCAEGGVLGALCGQVGSVMATEAVKLILGVGEPLLGRVLVLDALASRWSEVPLRGDPGREWPTDGRTDDVAAMSDDVTPADDVAPADAALPAISARELAALLAAPDGFALIDVREPAERDIVAIPGARSVPLGGILDGSALAGLPRDRPLVLHCKSGVRSAQAGLALRAAGFGDVSHLAGGVLAWVDDVDPSLARY
ncbi:ThiF family adenylyltransferase [Pengzhenrongella sicca]|uniref:ThiF family adenylyltransferase n=1 Tax=Pengzhenrongella sicca TaxID=2819238 RepID=A0A8A4ZGS0_9MICO|nr:ThiF family adenylyltransferase [Pengzhenrongella sicca]QTE30189.1 ThiF family adenylyltransferase [Pengzhenrongella sicca]